MPPVSTTTRTTSLRKRRPHGKPPSAGTTSTQSSGSPKFERSEQLSNTPQLGAPPRRITVNAELVRRLVAGQFPQWAGLPIRMVADGGWDNWTFHLGSD